MTVTPENNIETAPRRMPAGLRLTLSGIGALFMAGVIAGYSAVMSKDSSIGALQVGVLALLVALLGFCLFDIWRTMRRWQTEDGLASPRVKRSRALLIASGVVGGVIGMMIAMQEDGSGNGGWLFSDGPLPSFTAMAIMALILIGVPALLWFWHRSIDEHEAEANRDGALMGIYAYSTVAPAWWIGWRGGVLPELNGEAIFLLVMAVWGVTWMWRRYR
ncbi:MAG: hypothetical protein RIQ46_1059 [Pseudomonadota bacterium]|jgi:hypothetical protein